MQTLCINQSVLDLGSGTQINERCLDMQEAASKKAKSDKVAFHAHLPMLYYAALSFLGECESKDVPCTQDKKPKKAGGCPYLSTKTSTQQSLKVHSCWR